MASATALQTLASFKKTVFQAPLCLIIALPCSEFTTNRKQLSLFWVLIAGVENRNRLSKRVLY